MMRTGRLTLLAVLLGLMSTATASGEPRHPGWGESEAFPVYLRVAVQPTLPASFVFEVLQPTVTHLRRTLPYALISQERLPPAELYQAVRTQGVHAFVADSGFFCDLQSRGWAEQIAALQPQGVLDPAYVSGMAAASR